MGGAVTSAAPQSQPPGAMAEQPAAQHPPLQRAQKPQKRPHKTQQRPKKAHQRPPKAVTDSAAKSSAAAAAAGAAMAAATASGMAVVLAPTAKATAAARKRRATKRPRAKSKAATAAQAPANASKAASRKRRSLTVSVADVKARLVAQRDAAMAAGAAQAAHVSGTSSVRAPGAALERGAAVGVSAQAIPAGSAGLSAQAEFAPTLKSLPTVTPAVNMYSLRNDFGPGRRAGSAGAAGGVHPTGRGAPGPWYATATASEPARMSGMPRSQLSSALPSGTYRQGRAEAVRGPSAARRRAALLDTPLPHAHAGGGAQMRPFERSGGAADGGSDDDGYPSASVTSPMALYNSPTIDATPEQLLSHLMDVDAHGRFAAHTDEDMGPHGAAGGAGDGDGPMGAPPVPTSLAVLARAEEEEGAEQSSLSDWDNRI